MLISPGVPQRPGCVRREAGGESTHLCQSRAPFQLMQQLPAQGLRGRAGSRAAQEPRADPGLHTPNQNLEMAGVGGSPPDQGQLGRGMGSGGVALTSKLSPSACREARTGPADGSSCISREAIWSPGHISVHQTAYDIAKLFLDYQSVFPTSLLLLEAQRL